MFRIVDTAANRNYRNQIKRTLSSLDFRFHEEKTKKPMSSRTARPLVMCGFLVVSVVKPWVMPPRTLRLAAGNTIIPERGSCTESELKEVSSQMRH